MKIKAILVWIVCIMMITTSSVSFAAQSDVYNSDGTPFASAKQMNVSSNLQKQVNATASKFLYEGAGSNLYTMNDAFSAWGTASGDPTTFVSNLAEKPRVIIKTALISGISAANTNKTTATVSTDGTNVLPQNKWVTQAVMTAYETAIATAQAVANKTDATQIEVNNTVAALTTATGTFNALKAFGTMVEKSKVATLNSLRGGIFNDSTGAVEFDIEIQGFSPTVTSYAITIYDPYPVVKDGKYLNLTGTTTDPNATVTFDGDSPQALNYNAVSGALISGIARAKVTAEDRVTTKSYEVNYTVDNSKIELYGDSIRYYDSWGGDSMSGCYLQAFNSEGIPCLISDIGQVSVYCDDVQLTGGVNGDYVNGCQYYIYTDGQNSQTLMIPGSDWVMQLEPGYHWLELRISKNVGGKVVTFSGYQLLEFIDTTPTITYSVIGSYGSLNIYKAYYNSSTDSFSFGPKIPSGGSAQYDYTLDKAYVIVSAKSTNSSYQIKSLTVTGGSDLTQDAYQYPDGFVCAIDPGYNNFILEMERIPF